MQYVIEQTITHWPQRLVVERGHTMSITVTNLIVLVLWRVLEVTSRDPQPSHLSLIDVRRTEGMQELPPGGPGRRLPAVLADKSVPAGRMIGEKLPMQSVGGFRDPSPDVVLQMPDWSSVLHQVTSHGRSRRDPQKRKGDSAEPVDTKERKKQKMQDPVVQPAAASEPADEDLSSGLDENLGFFSGDECSEECYPIMTEEEKKHRVGVSVVIPLGGDLYCTECYKWATPKHIASEQHLARVAEVRKLDPAAQLAHVTRRIEEVANQSTPPHSPAVAQSDQWFMEEQGWPYCLLCLQWSDKWHKESRRHLRRVEEASAYSQSQIEGWLGAQREKALRKLRGGAGDDAAKPSEPDVVSQEDNAPLASWKEAAVSGTEVSSSACVQWSCGSDSGRGVNSGVAVERSPADRASDAPSLGDSELGEFSADEETTDPHLTLEEAPTSCIACKRAVMTVRLRASRFVQELRVCHAVKIDVILEHVALLLSVTPHRLCLLHGGALVGTWGTLRDYAETIKNPVSEEYWLVATWPLSTSPKEYRLRMGPAVQMPVEVLSCDKRDTSPIPQDLDFMEDDVFQAALSETILPDPAEEQYMMHENDYDVLTVKIRRQRDDFLVHCSRGAAVSDLRTHIAKKKRVARSATQLCKSLQEEEQILLDVELYMPPLKQARRGGTKRSVTIKDEAELQIYDFDEYETVADFVETNLKSGHALWHGHLCLAGDLLVEDVAHLQLRASSEVPTYWLRCRGACVRAGYIHLAELVLWFYLPGDMVPGWVIADEPAMDQRHQGLAAAFTAYNYEAQLHRHRSRRGGAPKMVGGRLQWESRASRSLQSSRLEKRRLSRLPPKTYVKKPEG